MSDQAPTVDSPEPVVVPADGDAQQQTQQEIDWQKRATDNQSAYTQSQQELARYRQQVEQYADPEYRAQLFREIAAEQGYEIQADEPPSDPTEQLARELAELKQWRDEFTGNQQQEQYVARMEASVDQQLDAIGGLEEEDKDWIVSRAIALPPTSEGLPDIATAHQQLVARDQKRLQSWAKTKPRSAFTTPAGQQASQVPNLDKHEDRVAWYMSRLDAEAQ